MTRRFSFRCFKSSPKAIRLAAMLYVRYLLSLRHVEDFLHGRSIGISPETARFWWNRFGSMFSAEIRRKRVERMRTLPHWRWHLYGVCVKINGGKQDTKASNKLGAIQAPISCLRCEHRSWAASSVFAEQIDFCP